MRVCLEHRADGKRKVEFYANIIKHDILRATPELLQVIEGFGLTDTAIARGAKLWSPECSGPGCLHSYEVNAAGETDPMTTRADFTAGLHFH